MYAGFTISLLQEYTEIKSGNIDELKIVSTVCSYLTNFGPYVPIGIADGSGKVYVAELVRYIYQLILLCCSHQSKTVEVY